MRYAILGPLEVWRGTEPVVIGGPQPRALLAVLLVHAGRVVPADRLIHHLWGERPPANARGLLHGCVAGVRRAIREGDRQPLRTRGGGYLLEVGPGELDADEFEQLAVAAGRAGSAEEAADLLYRALDRWRGPPLDGIVVEGLQPVVARLTERRLEVIEQRIECDLALGRAGLVAELRDRVRENPLREGFWLQLMRALAQAGRRADALDAYQELRGILVGELGVEPGPAVRELHRRILAAEETAPHGAAPPLAAPRPDPPRPDPQRPDPQRPDPQRPDPQRPDPPRPDPQPAPDQEPEPAGTATAPAQLPPAVGAFTGRADQLKWLDELADDGATMVVAAVTGSAGVGKTALAVHWAHQVRDRFPDGQLYADLRGFSATAPVTPLAALTGFLRTLGVPAEQVPVAAEPATALYRSLLAGRRVLVVLDNAAGAEQVRPLLPGTPGCLALVTSRDRLAGLVARDGARPLALDVLPPEEAGLLLGRLLGNRAVAEPEATAELARRCAYLPLALRIAAADAVDGVAAQVERLRADDRLDALAVDGDQDTAVRAAFDLSYDRLDPLARRLFRLLGVVPAVDVTAPAAAALTGLPAEQATRLLRRLADAHLLAPVGTGRYGWHDLLRSYAADRAGAEEEPAARAAAVAGWLDWCAGQAAAAARVLNPEMLRLPEPAPSAYPPPADHEAALAWLDAERSNLVAAVRYAADHGPAAPGWRLADALRGYFWLRMYLLDWLEVAGAGLAAATAGNDPRGQAAAHLSLGDAHGRQGRHPEAVAHYQRALSLHRRTGWRDGESAALGNLGNVYWWMGDLPAAAEHYQAALELAERTGRVAGQANNLGNLGEVYAELGDLEMAAALHRRALALDRRLGSTLGAAVDLGNLGRVELELGQREAAHAHLRGALAGHRAVGDRPGEAETLRVLAELHLAAGEPEHAHRLAEQAVELATETDSARFEADARNTLGHCELARGRSDTAVALHERALALATASGGRHPHVVALTGLAAALAATDPQRAASCARRAVDLARAGGFRLLERYAREALAACRRANPEPVVRVRSATPAEADSPPVTSG